MNYLIKGLEKIGFQKISKTFIAVQGELLVHVDERNLVFVIIDSKKKVSYLVDAGNMKGDVNLTRLVCMLVHTKWDIAETISSLDDFVIGIQKKELVKILPKYHDILPKWHTQLYT